VTSLLFVSHGECIQGAPFQGKHNPEGATRNGSGVAFSGWEGSAGNAFSSPPDLFMGQFCSIWVLNCGLLRLNWWKMLAVAFQHGLASSGNLK